VGALAELARYFLRLGLVGFGGPSAHIAAMHEELVRRRRWVDDRHFLDIVGVTNLIPGPNSSEIAIHLGYVRAGLAGGIVAGLAFLLPAFLMLLGISWVYFRVGAFEVRENVLAGLQAVALAAIVVTLWRLRSAVVGGWQKPVLALAGLGLTLWFPAASALVILGAGLASALTHGLGGRVQSVALLPLVAAAAPSGSLALVFLKTGVLLFGGGLVLVPLLAPEVLGRGWLTERQFLDGIALGQATPGPIVLTSVFVGYAVGGVLGSIVATAAIYLPSFLAVLAGSGPFLRRFRDQPAVASFVEGVTAAALGAVLAAAILLAETGLAGPFRIALFVAAGAAILARVPVVWTVIAGAGVGAAAGALGWT
jgi:chromate transporter